MYKGHRIGPEHFNKDQIKLYIVLVPIALFMFLPLEFIFVHAFKPMAELFAFPAKFYVVNPTWDNFNELFRSARTAGIPLSRYVINSLFVTVIVVAGNILISTMAGFALSKMKFALHDAIWSLNQTALMFVATAVAIPRYLIVTGLHITNTYWAHILPLLAAPVTLFLIKQFIDGVPDALLEAASIDGANAWTIYWRIILPLVKPAISTGMILSFQQVWGYLDSSNMYVNTDSMKTLAFYMSTLANSNNVVAGQGVAAAASLIMFIPNLILFIVVQKDVMNTMASSGIK